MLNYIRKINNYLDESIKKTVLLLTSIIIANIMINSRMSQYYHFLNENITIIINDINISFTIYSLINNFLMTIFFFILGIEIKREILYGYLKRPEQKLLPIITALMGVIFPIIIYTIFNYDDKNTIQGWAIPTTTDIPLTLGIYNIFAKNLSKILKVLVTSIAIIDDLIAIIIITFFYQEDINIKYLIPISICMLVLFTINKCNITNITIYIITGIILWYLFLYAGIHPTISGTITAVFMPMKNNYIKNYERWMIFYVDYIIIPLFIFSNCSIYTKNIKIGYIIDKVVVGISLGLSLGKIFGIYLSIYTFKKLRFISLLDKVKSLDILFISSLCGIGFTMSILISSITFEHSPLLLQLSKLGIILGSTISIIIALGIKNYSQRNISYNKNILQ